MGIQKLKKICFLRLRHFKSMRCLFAFFLLALVLSSTKAGFADTPKDQITPRMKDSHECAKEISLRNPLADCSCPESKCTQLCGDDKHCTRPMCGVGSVSCSIQDLGDPQSGKAKTCYCGVKDKRRLLSLEKDHDKKA